MSDGTINLPKRATPPDAPLPGRHRIFVDQTDNVAKYRDGDTGVITSFKGDQGDQGPQGAQGVQGVQGNPGTDGVDGVDGAQGPAGAMTVEGVVFETGGVTLPNSTTKQIIYSDTINHSTTGDCYVLLSLAFRGHSTGNDTEFDVQYDGVILDPESVEEVKDTSTTSSLWRTFVIGLGSQSAGNKTINLRFSKESTGGTAVLKAYTAIVVRYT